MTKKIMSAMLALVFALSVFAPAFGVFAANYPYIETDDYGNITYHRLSNGRDLAFNTDYDEMVYQIRSALISHSENIEYYFATTDETYAYTYEEVSQQAAAQAVADKLYDDIINDIFEIGKTSITIGGGEYLYNSIINIGTTEGGSVSRGNAAVGYYASAQDNPQPGSIRYYTFCISFEGIQYYTTPEQERLTEYFASWFSGMYLDDEMTEYERVKTIYDFIVRNTTYDYDVYNASLNNSTTTVSTERNHIAHSAFGAIYGNILNMVEDGSIYNGIGTVFASKSTVTDAPVPVNYDQGMAVCEGFSKLFYYLCTFNGIRCHIVDGDYIADSGKNSDPHEWNYVYLQDESGDGYKWFQVDCTLASTASLKQIDLNSYNYFLCGKENVYFGWKNHQEAYENRGLGKKEQLYDWYDGVNESSYRDYVFRKVHMNSDNLSSGYIICRTTVYEEGGSAHNMHILYRNGHQIIEVNEEGLTLTEVEGFIYTGYSSTFSVMLPYVVNRINILDDGTVSEGEFTTSLTVKNTDTGATSATAKTAGNYAIDVYGEGDTLSVPFEITRRNMSEDAIKDDSVVLAYDYANYTGNAIVPQITITDPFRNRLVENRDYKVSFIKDNQTVSQIKDIGEYKIRIEYTGNYYGVYYLDFTMDGVDLSRLSYSKRVYQYMPKYYREQNGMTSPVVYFKQMVSGGIKVGTVTLYPDTDFSVTSSSTGLEYGNTGNIILTGLANSNVKAGTKITVPYEVSKKFDISGFNGKAADTNTVNKVYYTGSAVKPTKFDWLDTYLVQGKDYRITGYTNNVEVGYAYVKIQGIGGCEGSATLKFYINPPRNLVKPSSSNNKVKLSKSSYIYNGGVNKPTVKFLNSAGKAISTYYYTISYKGGKAIGTSYAVINLRNGYSGSIKIPYSIVPKGTSLKSVAAGKKTLTVKWAKQATQTSGYQLQYGTSSSFSGAKTVNITKNTTVSKKLTKLKSRKIYYVRVRTYKTVNGTKRYSSWSKGLGIKVK